MRAVCHSMPLEDFFTLTEMKDGLATLARVEELVGVIKEKEKIRKNVGDAAWQWSTVAGVLAATESKDCLHHFVELDGLLFLAQWLQEAQKCSGATNDSFIEDSINALLGALEKLPVDHKRLIASGINITVRNLLGHNSFKVQEKARALFGSWGQVRDENSNCDDVDEALASFDDELKSSPDVKLSAGGCPSSPVLIVSPLKESAEGSTIQEIAGSEYQHPKIMGGSNVSHAVTRYDVKMHTSHQDRRLTISNEADAKSLGSSPLPNTFQEISAASKESSSCLVDAEGMTSSVSEFKGATDGAKEVKNNINVKAASPSNITEKETHDVSQSCRLKEPVSLPGSPINGQKLVTDTSVTSGSFAKENESCLRKTVPSDIGSDDDIPECQQKDSVVDCGIPTSSGHITDLKHVEEDGKFHAEDKLDLSSNGFTSRTIDGPENSLYRKGAFKAVVVKELVSESNSEASEGENSVILSDILKRKMDTEDQNEMDKRNSDVELDYGVDDALEVARQVAKEVEREVVDYRGPFCSSPENNLEGEIMQSPDSVQVEQDEPMMDRPSGIEVQPLIEKDLCSDASSPEAKRMKMSYGINMEPEEHRDKLESPPSTPVVQEFTGNNGIGRCNFDLNEDVFTQEGECSMVPVTNQQFTLSAPIPVVAASKGTPGLPSVPLQFEGELGWKGSASTSAFRPASPRRTPEGGDKISSVGASSNGSKQKRSFLEIDLNVAGDENDPTADLALAKHVSLSSGLPSGESSVEVSSMRAERLNLDLNRLGESDDGCTFQPSDWRVDGRFHHHNGHHSQSPSSSSSSRKPPMVEFDLNDNPLVHDTCGSHVHWQNLSKSSLQEVRDHVGVNLDDPVVSIMGSRINVGRKEFHSRTLPFLSNGQGAESAFNHNWPRPGDSSAAQPSLSYAPPLPPAFGYNDLTVGHSMSFPLPMYGPTSSLPYVVDFRGAAVMPQMLGTAATISTPTFSRPPLFMGLAGSPTGPSGVGATRSGPDLNSGMVTVDRERREVGSLRQFFGHGHGGAAMEPMRSLPPPGMGMTLKQKEP